MDLSTRIEKVELEYANSGGNLALTTDEFKKFFGFKNDVLEKIIKELTSSGRYVFSTDLDSTTKEEIVRLQLHPNYAQNYWLKLALIEEEAEILLELGALFNQPILYQKKIKIRDKHIIRLYLGVALHSSPFNQLSNLPESLGSLKRLEW